MALVVVHEAAVGGEHLVRDHDRQVVVALRDRQRVLELVAHEVHRGQAHVGVLGRVVHAVVVVPERARLLVVRELVGLALADPGDVAGVAVVLRLRGRAVQVGRRPGLVAPVRVLRRQLVAHGHVQRGAPARQDRRSRSDAVVAEDRGLDAGQDHGVLHLLGDGDRAAPTAVDHRRHFERQGVRLRDLLLGDLGRGLGADRPLERQRDCRRPQRRHFQHVPSRQGQRPHDFPHTVALLRCRRHSSVGALPWSRWWGVVQPPTSGDVLVGGGTVRLGSGAGRPLRTEVGRTRRAAIVTGHRWCPCGRHE